MRAVIMAGGKGTRIASVASDIPKPMIKIAGKPVLEYEIESLRESGYRDIILVVGHLGDVIKSYFGDGEKWDVRITYYTEEIPLGTAGAIFCLQDVLTEPFFLLNGDILIDVDFQRMEQFHKEKGGDVTLFTHPNNHPFDSALIVVDDSGKVTGWLHKEERRHACKNRVNAGIHVLSPSVLKEFRFDGKCDLDRDILKPLVARGRVFAYDSPEYVKDMGTPERLSEAEKDVESGIVYLKNLQHKQKAVFLDRDGTLNKYKGFITKPEQIELIEDVAEAVRIINGSGYLAIVISNQPVIARGECTLEELNEINNTLEELLGKEGAYLDGFYCCPHHPDKGFQGERPEYKIDCQCRKPKPGLLIEATGHFNIRLSDSFMVGDSITDLEAAVNAGCKPVLIGKESEREIAFPYQIYDTLSDFVKQLICE